MKRSPLQRRTPLARGTSQLRRTQFVDHNVSRRQIVQAKFARAVRSQAGDRGLCQGCPLIIPADQHATVDPFDLWHPGEHAHHVTPKSRGGPNDPSNGAWVCARAHRWIHDNPAEAERLGLLKSSCTPQGTPSTLDRS